MIVKVLVAIPNMGYTQVEAYGDRLMNFMHLGNLQTEVRVMNQITEILAAKDPVLAAQVQQQFIDEKSLYVKQVDGDEIQFYFINIGRIFTPAAREEAAKYALEYQMDFLYFVDDDMICPNDMFAKLYRHRAVADIVCPLAFTRNPPHKPVLYASIEGWDPSTRSDYFINNNVMRYPKNKLVRADACGFGAALIKTWIFKKVAQPWFMSSCGTGEDILFCYKAGKAGAKIYMDTSLKIGHLSHPRVITEEYVEEFRKQTDPLAEKRYPVLDKYEALTILGD